MPFSFGVYGEPDDGPKIPDGSHHTLVLPAVSRRKVWGVHGAEGRVHHRQIQVCGGIPGVLRSRLLPLALGRLALHKTVRVLLPRSEDGGSGPTIFRQAPTPSADTFSTLKPEGPSPSLTIWTAKRPLSVRNQEILPKRCHSLCELQTARFARVGHDA